MRYRALQKTDRVKKRVAFQRCTHSRYGDPVTPTRRCACSWRWCLHTAFGVGVRTDVHVAVHLRVPEVLVHGFRGWLREHLRENSRNRRWRPRYPLSCPYSRSIEHAPPLFVRIWEDKISLKIPPPPLNIYHTTTPAAGIGLRPALGPRT